MSRLVYFFIYLGMWLLASLPMKALYVLSDVLYVLMYKLARYRRRVVWRNLKNSFPEKTEKELLAIERKFYHYICDYMLESLKMPKSCPQQALLQHFCSPYISLAGTRAGRPEADCHNGPGLHALSTC